MQWLQNYIENLISSSGYEVSAGLWIIWLSFFLLIALSFLSFIAVLGSRYRKDYLARWEKSFNEKVEGLLLALIYDDYASFDVWKKEMDFEKFAKKYLQKKRGKKLFITNLSVLRSRLNGDDAALLAEVYRKSKLFEFSLSQLKSRNWQVKAAAILDLGALNYVEAVVALRPLANHPHEEVRAIAQLALIQLDSGDVLRFLDNLKHPISLSNRIRLHGAMLQKASLEIKSFERWLRNSNDDVVLFATIMAGLFNSATDEKSLMELVTHKNVNIAKAAIKSLEQLGAPESLVSQIDVLNDASIDLQSCLIASLKNLSFRNELIIERWLESESFEVVKAAFELLNDFKSTTEIFNRIEQLNPTENLEKIKVQFAHFKQKQVS